MVMEKCLLLLTQNITIPRKLDLYYRESMDASMTGQPIVSIVYKEKPEKERS